MAAGEIARFEDWQRMWMRHYVRHIPRGKVLRLDADARRRASARLHRKRSRINLRRQGLGRMTVAYGLNEDNGVM